MDAIDRRWMAGLGALQGLAIWLLAESWPASPQWAALSAAALYFVAASGLVLHLGRSGGDRARLLRTAAAVGAAFGLVALWVGWQLPAADVDFDGDDARVTTWALASAVAIFVLGPFVQIFQRTGRARFPYPDLYRHSWNNFFIAALGLVYVWAVWAVLVVWSQLFELIGIGFFEDLFSEPFVVYGISGGAIGYGLAAARENERVIGALRGITQALFRAVLPVLSGVTLGFVATLPFTGLEALFGATSAATVLLWWLVLGIVLLNAVYLDGSEAPPYAAATRRVVEAGVGVTPVLAALALYAVGLRIEQHGLTPQRVFAALLAAVLSLYALGYAASVVWRRSAWLGLVRPVNIAVAWVWIALAFAVHTPLLDPLGWSLRNQLARLEAGRVDPVDFDYAHLRFHLGRRGAEALERLARGDLPEAARERIELARSIDSYWEWSGGGRGAEEALAIERLADGGPWPDGLRSAVRLAAAKHWELQRCREGAGDDVHCLVRPLDLDGDGDAEEIVFVEQGHSLWAFVFERDAEGGFARAGRMAVSQTGHVAHPSPGPLVDAIRAGDLHPVPPPYPDLEIETPQGRHRLRLDPF